MDAVIEREQMSFSLKSDLLQKLKKAAKKANRSLNDYVESVLNDAIYYEPNAETKKAIADVEAGKDLKAVDMNNFEAFMKSCSE